MGPGRAADIIPEGMFRGADGGFLLTDRAFAGSDTLATSYALSCAMRKIKSYDVILAGRQAIDGDTAQVGPQVAEKLGLPQITYAEEVLGVDKGKIAIRRRLERGVEVVESPLPCLVTVNGSAAACRPRNAKLVMKFKHARTLTERQTQSDDYISLSNDRVYLNIQEWGVNDVETDAQWLGLKGSPTKVKTIENVVFQAKESKTLTSSDKDIEDLVKELILNHTIG
jgi:electron transfer flavoprotein beta subunit